MKKIVLLIIFILLTGYLLRVTPFGQSILNNFSNGLNSSALTVSIKKGTAKVYVDNKYVGNTPLKYFNVSVGAHTIKLERVSGNYPVYIIQMQFTKGTNSLINWDLGPTQDFSSGMASYFITGDGKDNKVIFNTNNTDVYLNNKKVGNGSFILSNLFSSMYNVKITKNGFESMDFQITPQTGYILVINVKLFKIPFLPEKV